MRCTWRMRSTWARASCQRVVAAPVQVPGVQQQVDEFGVGRGHQPVDLGAGLDAAAHVVVVAQARGRPLGELADLVQPVHQPGPLFVVEDGLVRQHRDVGELMHRVAELGHHDALAAHLGDERDLAPERLDREVGHVGIGEVEAHPRLGDLKPAHAELLLQPRDVRGVLVANAAPLEACESHLAHALLEGNVVPDPAEVVVGPAGRHDREADGVAVEHRHGDALLEGWPRGSGSTDGTGDPSSLASLQLVTPSTNTLTFCH